MLNRFLGVLTTLLFMIQGSTAVSSDASDLAEIDLAEENESRPVLLMMYSKPGEYPFTATDAKSTFSFLLGDAEKNLRNIAHKNAALFTLKAKGPIEFTKGAYKYTAEKDAPVLFGILLGASGNLNNHSEAIPLPKGYYWQDKKDKKTITVLGILRQWATRIGVDNPNTFTQPDLCHAIEAKLSEEVD